MCYKTYNGYLSLQIAITVYLGKNVLFIVPIFLFP